MSLPDSSLLFRILFLSPFSRQNHIAAILIKNAKFEFQYASSTEHEAFGRINDTRLQVPERTYDD
jgi:hypothetical protein